jgi:hypothetical protein
MVKHTLTVALVKHILQVLDRLGPTVARHRWQCPRHRGRRGRWHHRTMLRGTLDLDRLHQTKGDPGSGPSRPAPKQIPNPRVRVTPIPPSPPHAPPAYWSMEPSDLADSLWGHQEPPCVIHGLSPCPYPVAQRQPVFTSPGEGEGGEGVTVEEEMAWSWSSL